MIPPNGNPRSGVPPASVKNGVRLIENVSPDGHGDGVNQFPTSMKLRPPSRRTATVVKAMGPDTEPLTATTSVLAASIEPGAPVTPVAPVSVADPGVPGGPVAPVHPVLPVPCAPVQPVAPLCPVLPVFDANPAGPCMPVCPVAPVPPVDRGPVLPVTLGPGTPVWPWGPVAPRRPSRGTGAGGRLSRNSPNALVSCHAKIT